MTNEISVISGTGWTCGITESNEFSGGSGFCGCSGIGKSSEISESNGSRGLSGSSGFGGFDSESEICEIGKNEK